MLKIKGLKTYFFTSRGIVKAVDGADLSVRKGEIVSLVGESGCGKTALGLSIMRLIPHPGRTVGGRIEFLEQDLLSLDGDEMRQIRGNKISMIFQEPMTSLNPLLTIGEQIIEVMQAHKPLSILQARKRAIDLLRLVEINSPELRLRDYPHRLSGGERQRVMIACALAMHPLLLIADEPTTALDVTVQAGILRLLKNLNRMSDMSILFITHDLALVSELAHRAFIMYAGRIMEYATVRDLLRHPRHPYTVALLEALPRLGTKRRLRTIQGKLPDPFMLPSGCLFYMRCPQAIEMCKGEKPKLRMLYPGHWVRCFRAL